MQKVIVVGGGAAGVFGAIAAAEHAHVILLERTGHLLAKVRISGGGRCNVTHACFDPKELVAYYPRGKKELLGSFFRFQPKDTIAWFEARGVSLKTEADGRVFPATDSSDTIIRCLTDAAVQAGVDIRLNQRIAEIKKADSFHITLENGETLEAGYLLLATGSSPQGLKLAAQFGHTLIPPVPSLFTFNVPTSPLSDLAGISLPSATVRLPAYGMQQQGPLLITHWGFSGPAVLKLSSHAAKELHRDGYKTQLIIQWVPIDPLPKLLSLKKSRPAQCLETENLLALPQNL